MATMSQDTTAQPPAGRSHTNLYVCNLPRGATDRDVQDVFSPFGAIASSMVLRDVHTGRSSGTAFVRYVHPASAEAARAALHKHRLSGERWAAETRRLSVRWAKETHDEAVPVGDARAQKRELFVRNVPLDVSEMQLAALMSPFGLVVRVRVCADTQVDPRNPCHIAFVLFGVDGAADAALHRVHNTCPFDSCRGVPLMCKLKEELHRQAASVAAPSRAATTPRSCSAAASVAGSSALQEATPVLRCAAGPVARPGYRHDPYSWAGAVYCNHYA